MWGGVKRSPLSQEAYGAMFRGAVGAVDSVHRLRQGLRLDPRPWAIFHGLEQQRAKLTDPEVATLLRWCRDVVQLTPASETARRQETLQLAGAIVARGMADHRGGQRSWEQYMALCESSGDLQAAFAWFEQHLTALEARGEAATASDFAWLLRCAASAPADEDAVDVVTTVLPRLQGMRSPVLAGPLGLLAARPLPADVCGAVHDHVAQLSGWGAASAVEVLLHGTGLEEGAPRHENGWGNQRPLFPLRSLDAEGSSLFEQRALRSLLPSGEAVLPVRGSLLPQRTVASLCAAAAAADTPRVAALVEEAKAALKADHAAHVPERVSWMNRGRYNVLCGLHADGLLGSTTPELYHYVVVSLVRGSRVGLAVEMLARMDEAGVQPLDATLLECCAAAGEDPVVQAALFKQFRDGTQRATDLRDASPDAPWSLRWWWADDHLRHVADLNALPVDAFVARLGERIGASALCRLLGSEGGEASAAVLESPDLCRGVAGALVQRPGDVAQSLDTVASALPLLDVAMMGRVAYFDHYTTERPMAHTMAQLREAVGGLPAGPLHVLDASYIETSEHFMRPLRGAVVVPYVTLAALTASLHAPGPLDPDQASQVESERRRAADRLAVLARLACDGHVTVLHFTEQLLAAGCPLTETAGDNAVMAGVVWLLTVGCGREVALCSDDPALAALCDAVPAPVRILSSCPCEEQDRQDEDSACVLGSIPELFEPRTARRVPPQPLAVEQPAAAVEGEDNGSAWLDLLDDGDPPQATPPQRPETSPPEGVEPGASSFEEAFAQPAVTTPFGRGNPLHHEAARHRPLRRSEARQAAVATSHLIGAKVPSTLHYRVVEANVNDPRAAPLLDTFKAELQAKRVRSADLSADIPAERKPTLSRKERLKRRNELLARVAERRAGSK